MIGWIILGLIAGLVGCLSFVRGDPWKERIRFWEYEDTLEEAQEDYWDWQEKRGKYADRPGEAEA